MKRITVFTPTYNRAYCLGKLYESLCNQTSKDFVWLVIDDGSSDNTKDNILDWINEKNISIEYHFQKNMGMVAAHNTAHYLMKTELCVCIDSDDYMPKNAVERILSLWQEQGYNECAGMIGLDSFEDGSIVGNKFPEGLKECKFSELEATYNVKGDKKFVHNRKVFNQFLPYPFIEGEKFPVTSYLYLFIEQRHKYLVFNEIFCIINYLPDGLSFNLFNQYRQSPKSFAFYRIAKMRFALSYKDRFKNAIHYVSSSLMAKNYKFLFQSPYKFTTFLAIPFGILLYLYLTNTNKKSIMKKDN